MTGFVDTITESFKQTLNWSMWLYFFIILFIEGVITGIIALIFVFIGLSPNTKFLKGVDLDSQGFITTSQQQSSVQGISANSK